MLKLSNTSKMNVKGKRVRSWSLEAGVTCPQSAGVEVCKSCYALKNTYRFPVVKAVRQHNRDDYKTPDFVERMVAACSKLDMVRLFDSGDCETKELALKLEEVITKTPNISWWFPTRMDKSASVNSVLSRIALLPNVALRPSADNIGLDKPERAGVNSYVIRQSDIPMAIAKGINICPVTLPGSTQKSCNTCTTCYSNEKVAYVIH